MEKEDVTGRVTYRCRKPQPDGGVASKKIAGIANDIPLATVCGPDSGPLLIVGWGSTYGAIAAAVAGLQREGRLVSHLHLRHLNPLPSNVGDILSQFERVLVAENNCGQLRTILRSHFPTELESLHKVEGRPFLIREIQAKIEEILSRG